MNETNKMVKKAMSGNEVYALCRNKHEQNHLKDTLNHLTEKESSSLDTLKLEINKWRQFKRDNIRTSGWSAKGVRPSRREETRTYRATSAHGMLFPLAMPGSHDEQPILPWMYTYLSDSHNRAYQEVMKMASNKSKPIPSRRRKSAKLSTNSKPSTSSSNNSSGCDVTARKINSSHDDRVMTQSSGRSMSSKVNQEREPQYYGGFLCPPNTPKRQLSASSNFSNNVNSEGTKIRSIQSNNEEQTHANLICGNVNPNYKDRNMRGRFISSRSISCNDEEYDHNGNYETMEGSSDNAQSNTKIRFSPQNKTKPAWSSMSATVSKSVKVNSIQNSFRFENSSEMKCTQNHMTMDYTTEINNGSQNNNRHQWDAPSQTPCYKSNPEDILASSNFSWLHTSPRTTNGISNFSRQSSLNFEPSSSSSNQNSANYQECHPTKMSPSPSHNTTILRSNEKNNNHGNSNRRHEPSAVVFDVENNPITQMEILELKQKQARKIRAERNKQINVDLSTSISVNNSHTDPISDNNRHRDVMKLQSDSNQFHSKEELLLQNMKNRTISPGHNQKRSVSQQESEPTKQHTQGNVHPKRSSNRKTPLRESYFKGVATVLHDKTSVLRSPNRRQNSNNEISNPSTTNANKRSDTTLTSCSNDTNEIRIPTASVEETNCEENDVTQVSHISPPAIESKRKKESTVSNDRENVLLGISRKKSRDKKNKSEDINVLSANTQSQRNKSNTSFKTVVHRVISTGFGEGENSATSALIGRKSSHPIHNIDHNNNSIKFNTNDNNKGFHSSHNHDHNTLTSTTTLTNTNTRNHNDQSSISNNSNNNNPNNNSNNNPKSPSPLLAPVETQPRANSASASYLNARSDDVYHKGIQLSNYVRPELRYKMVFKRPETRPSTDLRDPRSSGRPKSTSQSLVVRLNFTKQARQEALDNLVRANSAGRANSFRKCLTESLQARIKAFCVSLHPYIVSESVS